MNIVRALGLDSSNPNRRPSSPVAVRKAPYRSAAALLLLAISPVVQQQVDAAGPHTWIGGNTTWADGLNNNFWDVNDEPDSDDDATIDVNNDVTLSTSNVVLSLTLSGSATLNTAGNDLDINGLLSISGSGTSLIVTSATSSVTPFSITTASSGSLVLDNGVVTMNNPGAGLNGVFTNGGTLSGRGTLTLADTGLAGATNLLNNNGTISASAIGLIIIGNPPAGTLTITASDATNGRVNLDGTAETGTVNVNTNQTLDINATIADTFNGDMNLFKNSTIDISTAWTLGTGGTIDVDNGATGGLGGSPANVAFIAGAGLTQTGGTITVVDNDGTLQFDAPFTMTGGDLVNNGTVVFNANSTIDAGANFTNPTATSSLTVNAGITVTVNQANFNADGTGSATNIITVNAGGLLDLNLGAGADEDLQGAIHLNGGTLSVSTTDNNWIIDGPLVTGDNTAISTVSGEELTLSTPSVVVGANSTLRLSAVTNFSGGSYTGTGTLQVQSNSNVIANTTIDTTTFDWDGTGVGSPHTIADGVTFTINSPNFDTDGDMDDPLTIGANGSTLTVNGPAAWTFFGALTTNPADAGLANIAGTSRMVLRNIFTVSGDTNIAAPVTFGASNTTTVAAAAVLTVDGDAIYTGSTITGAGSFNPSLTNHVTGNTTITVATFNFDKGGTAAWTVDPGVTLTVNVTDYDNTAPNLFQGTVTLNSGTASVTTGDAEFLANGHINLNNTTGVIPEWAGEPIDFGDDSGHLDAHLTVGGTGVSVISAQVDFNSDANVVVNAGANLVLTGVALFVPVNAAENGSFSGTGTFTLENSAVFSEATTLNFAGGGTVDLDGRASDASSNVMFVDAPLLINAASLAPFGKPGLGDVIQVDNNGNSGTLTVALDSAASSWTLNPAGTLNLLNDAAPATLLSGNSLSARGTINVTGDVRSAMRIDLGSSAIVNINTAAEPFRLNGGTLADPNTINGATINGPGLIAADNARALVGFGTVNANVDFDGASSELRAKGGILNVTNGISDVGIAGTADSTGTLNLGIAQVIDSTMTFELLGGNFTGAAITNQGLLRGNGAVANNTTNAATGIIRPVGGTLKFTGINGANAGRIELNNNTAEFNNALTNAATGLIVGPGTLRANSNLSNAGKLEAAGVTNVFGAVTTSAGGLIAVDAAATADFDSNVTIAAGANLTEAAGSTSFYRATLTINGTGVLAPNVSATSIVNLVINAGATLDTSNNKLVIDFAGASPANTIRGYILNGRLFSSTAAADALNRMTIGYAEASVLGVASWSGIGFTGDALLTKLTWFGDATMDGVVNADDFARIDHGLAFGLTGWVNGDFNHSGTITPADYQLIDRVFIQQTGVLPSPDFLATREDRFGPQYVSDLLASLPEPSLAAFGLALLPLTRRRDRRPR